MAYIDWATRMLQGLNQRDIILKNIITLIIILVRIVYCNSYT